MTGTQRIKTMGVWTLFVAMAAGAAVPEYRPERYDLILDRSPFGADPFNDAAVEKAAEAAASAAAIAAAKELRLCFLLESESGDIRAGFERLKVQPGDAKSVILQVGESFMGMKLVDIDLESSKATLNSQGKPVVFELTKSKTPAKKATPAAKPAQRRFGGGFRRTAPPPKPVAPPEPKLSPEEQRRRREEIRANLQDYQMEVIRSGMPPLPIPLTQEMDDQLVAEGVLDPLLEEE